MYNSDAGRRQPGRHPFIALPRAHPSRQCAHYPRTNLNKQSRYLQWRPMVTTARHSCQHGASFPRFDGLESGGKLTDPSKDLAMPNSGSVDNDHVHSMRTMCYWRIRTQWENTGSMILQRSTLGNRRPPTDVDNVDIHACGNTGQSSSIRPVPVNTSTQRTQCATSTTPNRISC
jgi:hypothetical protein